ncbi:MAG: hypothetical protein M3N98_02285, partial [Actinomycetota bacterium]|nr:hypothetical protein [Actinomycetota bacterium]
MSARLLRTITAVLLVMAGLGVIAAVTHSVQGGNRIVATGGGAGNAAVRDAFVGAGSPPTTASTDGFPPSGSGPQAGTSTATSASAAAPPTTQRRLGTTTVAPTKTTAPI